MSRRMRLVPLAVLCALIIAVPSVWANWVEGGVALCTAMGYQQSPQITSDGAGGAIVTWGDHRGTSRDIYAQRVNASGAIQWITDGVALCTATGDQTNLTIDSDGAGGAIVAWQDQRSGNNDIYAQRVNASGVAQWTTDGVAICTSTGYQIFPAIISDGAGGAIITWRDARDGLSNYDIYVQRVAASGVVQWTTNGVAVCTAVGDQRHPIIVSDGVSGALVAWEDGRSGNSSIYVQRVFASGDVGVSPDGVAICAATGGQTWPTITSDGAGGAIVTWMDYRNSSNFADIYAQRVNPSVAVQWQADGVALCTASEFQQFPTIISDGVGGAIVTWEDARSGVATDIYAQRVDASGVVQWMNDGVAICTATGGQDFPTITSDGAGGAIVTWQDYRSSSNFPPDIYAQRVNASGTPPWTSDGVALCTATWQQYNPTITSDGASGAIVTWEDGRSGISPPDIYALRVDANGFLVLTAADGLAPPLQLHQNYPNPFNPTTTVTYSIPERCRVTLEIYDVSGMCVARLVDTPQEKGSYEVEWSGKDGAGNSLASGIYFYRLTAGTQTISRKMVLLR